MADESLCIIATDKSLSGKVHGNIEKGIRMLKVLLLKLCQTLRPRRINEELVKHITCDFTEIDKVTCNDILDYLVNENKLINVACVVNLKFVFTD